MKEKFYKYKTSIYAFRIIRDDSGRVIHRSPCWIDTTRKNNHISDNKRSK